MAETYARVRVERKPLFRFGHRVGTASAQIVPNVFRKFLSERECTRGESNTKPSDP